MKLGREIFAVWKRNLLPALVGLMPLLAVVIVLGVSNFSTEVRTHLLIPGLGIAAWTFGVFFPREAPERSAAKCLAALLPLVLLSIPLGIWGTQIPEALRNLYPEVIRQHPLPPEPQLDGSHIPLSSSLIDILFFLLFALYFYLSGWTGRVIGGKTGRSLLAGFLVWLLAAPALSGLSAAVVLTLPVSEALLYAHTGLAYCFGFLPAIPLLIGWIVMLRRRGERNTPLWALRDFALGTAGSFLIFGIACGVTLVRAYGALELVRRAGRTLEFQPPCEPAGVEALATLLRSSAAWGRRCNAQDPKIDLPMESFYNWTTPDSPITPEMRKAALEELDSPEAKAFLAAAAALESHRSFFPEQLDLTNYAPILTSLRSAVRKLGSVAAIRHWHGQTDRILPTLQLEQAVVRTLDSAPKLAINGLVRISLHAMLSINLTQLGPDGPQYAAEYRRYLDYFLNTDYTVSDELEFAAHYLDQALRWPKELNYPYHNQPLPFFQRIFVISLVSNQVRERAVAQPQIAELRTAAKIEDGKRLDSFLDTYRSALKREKTARALFPTLLALKLHRSLTGSYPETLEELVPELLPALPIDPITGEVLSYTVTPEDFALTYRTDTMTITLGSKPGY